MVVQLARTAERLYPKSLLAEGFTLLLCAGCRPQDIRDLTRNRILENNTKILAYAKGSTAKAIDTLGFNVHSVRIDAGRAALNKIGTHASQRKLDPSVPIIALWNGTVIKKIIDAAQEEHRWSKELKWVAHGIRHGATQDIVAEYEPLDESIDECAPDAIPEKAKTLLSQLMGWKDPGTIDTYRGIHRVEGQVAAKDSIRFGDFAGANLKNKLRVARRNARAKLKFARVVPLPDVKRELRVASATVEQQSTTAKKGSKKKHKLPMRRRMKVRCARVTESSLAPPRADDSHPVEKPVSPERGISPASSSEPTPKSVAMDSGLLSFFQAFQAVQLRANAAASDESEGDDT